MMKIWATVVWWQQGIASLRCESAAGCSHCGARSGCSSRSPNELLPRREHQLRISILQPLEPGQRVELGINEGRILRLAMLVYMSPLMGLMFGGAVVQWWFNNDIVTILGAVLGGAAAFWVARQYASRLDKHVDYQPFLLQIAPPPNLCSFEQGSKLHTTREANSLN